MFVRWKRRLKRPKTVARRPDLREYVRYAVLVRSERVDGKPRLRFVRHLASIGEQYLDATAHQASFWRRVDWHLDDLALDPEVRQNIETALLGVVSRPTEAALVQLELEREQYRVEGEALARLLTHRRDVVRP